MSGWYRDEQTSPGVKNCEKKKRQNKKQYSKIEYFAQIVLYCAKYTVRKENIPQLDIVNSFNLVFLHEKARKEKGEERMNFLFFFSKKKKQKKTKKNCFSVEILF